MAPKVQRVFRAEILARSCSSRAILFLILSYLIIIDSVLLFRSDIVNF
jgi:hypothetical protein